MDNKLVICLSEDARITGIVGDNIHPLRARKGEKNPYIVYSNVSQSYINSINCDTSSLANYRYQIDAFSKSYNDIKAIRSYIVEALESYTLFDAVVQNSYDTVEDEGEWYRTVVDVSLWDKPEQPIVYLTDDAGNILTDEAGNRLTT